MTYARSEPLARRLLLSPCEHFFHSVGVEMIIADHPLHRSGQAALPHPAPTLGRDAQALGRKGMADASNRQPGSDQRRHTMPGQMISLTAMTQYSPPDPADRKTEGTNRRAIHRDAVIAHVPKND